MKLDVEKEIVLKFLGYGKKKAPKIIEKKLDRELEIYDRYLEAEYYMKSMDIEVMESNKVIFGKDLVIESKYLYKKLKDMKKAYILVYTVGSEIEKVIEEYSNGAEMMKTMIVDKIGIVALDNLKDKIVEKIEKEESPQVVSSVSYPSQGDFKVEYQKILFDLVKDEEMNISISESSQFLPLKTVLLVYGIGDKKDNRTMCDECDDRCH